jgi:hypothetical protein
VVGFATGESKDAILGLTGVASSRSEAMIVFDMRPVQVLVI